MRNIQEIAMIAKTYSCPYCGAAVPKDSRGLLPERMLCAACGFGGAGVAMLLQPNFLGVIFVGGIARRAAGHRLESASSPWRLHIAHPVAFTLTLLAILVCVAFSLPMSERITHHPPNPGFFLMLAAFLLCPLAMTFDGSVSARGAEIKAA